MAKQNKPIQRTPLPPKPVVRQKPTTAPPPRVKKEWKFRLTLVHKLCIALALLTLLLNVNTLKNGFVMDDVMVVQDNTIVHKGIDGVGELMSTPHMRGYLKLHNDTYRPLSLVMFAIEYEFWGRNPNGVNDPHVYHLFNILFYAGCVVVFFLFLNKLFQGKRTPLAFFAALLFAVHPIHTEVVANIKSGDEVLCFFFALLAINFYADYMKKNKILYLIFGSAALYLAFISKETVISFPAIIAVTFFLYLNENKMRAIYITASSVVVAGTYLLVRNMVLTPFDANTSSVINFIDNCLTRAPNYISRLATATVIMGDYLKLLFVPYPLICDHSYNSIPFTNFGNIWVLLSAVIYLGMIVVAIWLLIKNRKNPWSFGILFFLISIALFSNIFILIGSTMADRFMFFPSAGICILMAAAVDKWLLKDREAVDNGKWLTNKMAWVAILPVVLIYSGITYARNQDWQSNLSLYKADIGKAPNNTRLHFYYGCEFQKSYPDEKDPVKKQRIIDESIASLKKAIEIYPNYGDAHAELGVAYFRLNNYDSAMPEFYKTLQYNPHQSNASANMGTIYMNRKQYDSAVKYYHRTVDNNPGNALAWFNMAVCYSQVNKNDSAILGFKRAIEIAPDFDGYKAFQYIGMLYRTIGNSDSAIRYEQIAKNINAKLQQQNR